MAYTGTVVVIPTRNRSAIAMNAIRSVLDERLENVEVMVSDNSTSETEREALAAFCNTRGDARLRYVRPPEPLAMPAHWQWALGQALAFYQASHVTYLTDRMMFRTGSLAEALKLASLNVDKIVSYNMDRIVDHVRPIRVEQYPATQKLVEIQTVELSRLLSQSIFHAGLPRMLNCIVPREVFARMQERFGDVFSSIAPDFRFCCRTLEMEETILYYDKSLLFHYALDRSNGATVSRGQVSTDNVDFAANLPVDNARRNYATPIPQLITAVNAVFNEYLAFKQETNSPRFFELDLEKYLQANAEEIRQFENKDLRDEMLALLASKGFRNPDQNQTDNGRISVGKRLSAKLKRVATAPSTTGAWLFAARTFGIKPPSQNLFEFDTLDSAIDYARNISNGNYQSKSLRSVVPVSLRRALHERQNKTRLATLLRTKNRFRAAGGRANASAGINLVG